MTATSLIGASWRDLFGPLYLRRTLVVWVIWFSAYLVNYGLAVWLPSLYRTVFRLPLETSLQYGLITQAVGLLGTVICALMIDRVGRRPWFAFAFFAAGAALIGLWQHGADQAERVLAYVTVAYFFVSTINIGVYLYTPELYPTRVRSLGSGCRLRLAAARLDHRPDGGRLHGRLGTADRCSWRSAWSRCSPRSSPCCSPWRPRAACSRRCRRSLRPDRSRHTPSSL